MNNNQECERLLDVLLKVAGQSVKGFDRREMGESDFDWLLRLVARPSVYPAVARAGAPAAPSERQREQAHRYAVRHGVTWCEKHNRPPATFHCDDCFQEGQAALRGSAAAPASSGTPDAEHTGPGVWRMMLDDEIKLLLDAANYIEDMAADLQYNVPEPSASEAAACRRAAERLRASIEARGPATDLIELYRIIQMVQLSRVWPDLDAETQRAVEKAGDILYGTGVRVPLEPQLARADERMR